MNKLESTNASLSKKLLTAFLAAQMALLNAAPVWAVPLPNALPNTDDSRAAYDGAVLNVTPGGGTQTIAWNSFNIGSDAQVHFLDAAGDVTLNKIGGGYRSEIYGLLDANGRIYLLNPAGILFGSGSKVNVGGLVAAAMKDFDPSTGKFSKPGSGDITVQGGASINAGAFAYLIGRSVNLGGTVNSGDTMAVAYGGSEVAELDVGDGKIVLVLGGEDMPSDGGTIDLAAAFTNAPEFEVDGSTVVADSIALYAVGDIGQSGGAWTVGAPVVALTSAGGNITLDNAANKFGGEVAASAENGAITLKAADALTLGAVTAKDALTVEAGKISGGEAWKAGSAVLEATSSSIELTGAADIAAATEVTAARDIVLTNNANVFGGAVTGTAGNGHLWLNGNFGDSVDVTSQKDRVSLGVNSGSGPVKASAPEWRVEIWGTSTNDTLRVAGVTADDYVRIYGKGQANVEGEVKANGDIIIDPVALVLDAPVTSVSSNVYLQAIDIKSTANGTITAGDEAHIGHAHVTNVVLQGGVFATNLVYMNGRVIAVDGAIETGGDLKIITGTEGEARPGITQGSNGSVKVGGETYLASVDGDILFASEQNDFGTSVTAQGSSTDGTVTLVAANGINLDRVRASNLTVTAKSGDITQTADEKVIATGTSTLTATGGNITLTNIANNFGGAVAATGKAVSLTDNDGIVLGAVDADSLTVTAKGGAITQTAATTVKGETKLAATAGAITLDNAGNDFQGAVSAEGKAVTLTDANGIELGAVKADSLTVEAKNGDITQSGAAKVKGETTLTATGGNITVTNAANDFQGAVNAKGGAVALAHASSLTLGKVEASSLTATAKNIGQKYGEDKAIQVTGDTTLKATNGSIALDNGNNDFGGKVTAEAAPWGVTISDTNALTLGAVTAGAGIAAHAGGALSVEGPVKGALPVILEGGSVALDAAVESTGGDVSILTKGTVTSTTNGTITAGKDVFLGGKGTATEIVDPETGESAVVYVEPAEHATAITLGGDVKATGNAWAFGDSIQVDGKVDAGKLLYLSAASGDIAQGAESTVTAGGTAVLEAGGDIKMGNAGNDFQKDVQAIGRNVTLTDANGIELGVVDAYNTLTVEAKGGDITQTSKSTVEAQETATLTATGDITLANEGNDFAGTVNASGANVTLKDADTLALGEVTATAGAVDIEAISGGATVAGAVTATTDAKITATAGTIEVAETGSVAGDANTVLAGQAGVTGAGTVGKAGSALEVTADNGAIALDGQVLGSTADFWAQDDVTVANAGNDFTDTVSASGANVTLKDADTLTVGDVEATAGSVDLEAIAGDATVNGTVRGATNATIQATAGAVAVSGAGTVHATEGEASVTAQAGDATIDGSVEGKTAATVTATGGDAKVSGTVTSESAAKVESTDGAADVSGTVAATGEDATADVVAGTSANVTGAVTALQGSASVEAKAGDATIDGSVEGKTASTVMATGGAANLAGTLEATGEGGVARLESTDGAVSIDGQLLASGKDGQAEAVAGTSLHLYGAGKVSAEAEGGDALLKANAGDITLDGNAKAGQNLTVDASGELKVNATQEAGHDMALVAGQNLTVGNVQLLAGNSLVGKAGEDFSLTAAYLTGTNIGLEAGGTLDASGTQFVSSDPNNGVTLLKAKELLNLSGVQAGTLGLVSEGDITVTSLTAKKLAAKSTKGSVDVDLATDVELANLGNVAMVADRADEGQETVSVEGGLSGIQAAKSATVKAQNVSGSQVAAGGAVTINANSLKLQTLSGGNLDVTSGNTELGTVKAGGQAKLQTGNLTIRDLAAGSADIDSGNLKFDRMTANTVDINAKGTIQMGQLTAKKADITSGGSISDNNSHVKTDDLTVKAGGDIGSAGKPIELESGKINSISGKNVYLREMTSGKNVLLGTITAGGKLSLVAPRIGVPDGVYGFVDANGNAVNLVAPGGLDLDIAGVFGSPKDPMEAVVHGQWTLASGELHGMSNGDPTTGTPLNMIYMVFRDTTYDPENLPTYVGNGPIPGLVILNGRAVQGHPDLLRKIHSALAFSADTPELKSTQGVFGSPLFLDTEVVLTDMVAAGYVDYLKMAAGNRPEVDDLRNTTYSNVTDSRGRPRTLLWLWEDAFPTATLKPWLEQPALYPLHVLRASGAAKAKKDTNSTAPGVGLNAGGAGEGGKAPAEAAKK